MRKIILAGILLGFTGMPVLQAAEECPVSKDEANHQKEVADLYQAPAPATTSKGTGQANPQGNAQANANSGINAANKCLADTAVIQKQTEKLLKKTKGKSECSSQEEQLNKAKKKTKGDTATCEKALSALQGQSRKTGDNKDKMGGGDDKDKAGGGGGGDAKKDDKKEEKGEGGGGGMPQMPQMPQKKEEKKEDPVAKEKARQARIKECKARVETALELKKRDCKNKFPYIETSPVPDQKRKQEECIQTQIFASQAETAQCDYSNPPGM